MQQNAPQSPMGQQGQLNNLGNVMQMLMGSGNPMQMLEKMAMSNPQLQPIIGMLQACNGNPQQAFYALAQQRGIDPNSILSQIPKQ